MFNSVLLIANTGAATVNQVKDTIGIIAAQGVLPVAPKQDSLSLLDLILKGGFIMVPLGILSILTIYFFFERFMTLNKASKLDPNFMNHIKDYLSNGNKDAAKALCHNTTSPSARIIEKGVSRIGRPIKEIEAAMENVGKLEINRL